MLTRIPPRIVILDGYTMNPGDLSWDDIGFLGRLTVYDRTSPADVMDRSEGADMLLTNKTVLDRAIIEKLPHLRYIGVLATGYNVVDLAAADEHGIVVTNVPEYSTRSVAEAVFALILEMTRQAGYQAETVRAGRWQASIDFSYWDRPLVELYGKTMGIIGWGRIGRAVAPVAAAFGMRVIVHTRTAPIEPVRDIAFVGLDEVFSTADVVSLHCPLTPETQGMVNAARLASMKPDAFLINTGRGQLIVDEDLADALERGVIAGAGLDVLTVEPPRNGNPLIGARNCYITPHIAWASKAARERLMHAVTENIRSFLDGKPVNVVNTAS
jgi:glycerate dehydrogenase